MEYPRLSLSHPPWLVNPTLNRDLERPAKPVYSVKAHKQIVNAVDGCGGLNIGGGAPELVTCSRDGTTACTTPLHPLCHIACYRSHSPPALLVRNHRHRACVGCACPRACAVHGACIGRGCTRLLDCVLRCVWLGCSLPGDNVVDSPPVSAKLSLKQTGNSYSDEERCVAAGYDNGDVKLFDLRYGRG